jgi:hypothetical protein
MRIAVALHGQRVIFWHGLNVREKGTVWEGQLKPVPALGFKERASDFAVSDPWPVEDREKDRLKADSCPFSGKKTGEDWAALLVEAICHVPPAVDAIAATDREPFNSSWRSSIVMIS